MERRAWIAAWVLAAGCLFGSEPNCGAGTVLVDGQCVVAESQGTPGGDTPGGTPDGDTPPETVPSDPDAPKILSVSSNTKSMTDGDVLSITAIVTDPNGIDDLIGGELRGTGDVSYGAFVTSAQEGAYQIELTWSDLNTVQRIEFAGTGSRPFTIRFYDVAGHTVETPFDLELYCDQGGACDGLCTDLDADEWNCGQCGYACPDGVVDACNQGHCTVISDCRDDFNASCDQLCAASGLGPCVEADWGFGDVGVGLQHYETKTCNNGGTAISSCGDPPPEDGGDAGPRSMECACLE